MISIHALREEGDVLPPSVPQGWFNFYPRPPRGGRHCRDILCKQAEQFLSTPSARRATAGVKGGEAGTALFLSTPSARRATFSGKALTHGMKISIHALREEGDLDDSAIGKVCKDFYPRPPRGGRLGSAGVGRSIELISIHALREEGDHRHGALGQP